MTMRLRPATTNDAADIARVQVATWRTTYSGIVPQATLDALSEEKRTEIWTRILTAPGSRECLLVAEGDDEVVGFISAGRNRLGESKFTGEIYALYVLAKWQKKGIGRDLFRSAVSHLSTAGLESLLVWVLDGNPAAGFYARLGGEVIGEKWEELGGAKLKELGYGWTELPKT